MKELLVSVDVMSDTRPLAELVSLVGIQAGEGSHDRGERRSNRSRWKSARLRIQSPLPESEPIASHIDALLALVPEVRLAADIRVALAIGVLFDGPTVSLCLPLRKVTDRHWELDVDVYPCAEEEVASRQGARRDPASTRGI